MNRAFTVLAAFPLVAASAGWAGQAMAQAQPQPGQPIPGPRPHEEKQFVREAAVLAPPTPGSATVSPTTTVYFDVGRSDLKEGGRAALPKVAKLLQENPQTMVRVEGHTDAVGGELYNLQLGQARAYAVSQYLIRDLGIAPGRVQAVVFGKAVPAADNTTEGGRAMNRRVTMSILPMGSPVAAQEAPRGTSEAAFAPGGAGVPLRPWDELWYQLSEMPGL